MTEAASAAPELIRYKGQVVPWVSRWSGERDDESLRIAKNLTTGALTLFYEDTADPDRDENRDERGVLWARDKQDRSGWPEFGQVNSLRQRACMLERRCQVCGGQITETPIPWLMGPQHLYKVNRAYVTMSPPTCRRCADLSRELCPHLSTKGARLVLVNDYEVWGVYGEAVWFEPGDVVRSDPHAGISFAAPEHPLSGVLAKQLLVRFTDFTEVG